MTTVLRPLTEGQSTDPPAERLDHEALNITQRWNRRARLNNPRGTTAAAASAPGGAS
ncbi:MAG: hypothetical protein ACMG6S_15550 [Byssovorax sp.]